MLIFSSYNLIVAKNNNNFYRNIKELFINKQNLIIYIKRTLHHVCIEELFFRVYLNEFLEYCELQYPYFISSLCFSLGHLVNYYQLKQLEMHNIRMTINQIIYTFILSYNYLQQVSPLMSLLYHQYANLFCIAYNYYNYV
jgi:hypothetical protein